MILCRDIRPDQWAGFFETLTQNHKGSHVNVELKDPRLGVEATASNLRFVGISADAVAEGLEPVVRFLAGTGGDGSYRQILAAPSRVQITQHDGHEEAVEIRTSAGPSFRVEFD